MPAGPKRDKYHISRGEVQNYPVTGKSTDFYEIFHEHPDKPGHYASVGGAEVKYAPGKAQAGPPQTVYRMGGQTELFHMPAHPREATVDLMEMTQHASHMIPSMLGMMQNRAWEKGYPQGLQAPGDLSPHSAKLVGGLQKRGLVPGNHAPKATNDLTWQPDPVEDSYHRGAIVDQRPDDEIRAGSKTTRALLRASRPSRAHLSEQLEMF